MSCLVLSLIFVILSPVASGCVAPFSSFPKLMNHTYVQRRVEIMTEKTKCKNIVITDKYEREKIAWYLGVKKCQNVLIVFPLLLRVQAGSKVRFDYRFDHRLLKGTVSREKLFT